jgi:hypothetical protein
MPSLGSAEGNHTSGGFPFFYKAFLKSFVRFSFVTAGAKEKLGKRKRRGLFRLCGGDQRSARWISGRFLKKAT